MQRPLSPGLGALAMLLAVCTFVPPAVARPGTTQPPVPYQVPTPGQSLFETASRGAIATGAGAPRFTSALFGDTVQYGGTVWAADSNRWEARRDHEWTFDTGVASSLTGSGKPAGYHYRMEGWAGVDNSTQVTGSFRRAYVSSDGHGGVSQACAVISGNASLWAGLTAAEAAQLCYAAGSGYGNNWNITLARTFAYNGSGSVSFSFLFRVESELNFDYMDVYIDTSGNGSAPPILLYSYSGASPGTQTATLNLSAPAGTLPASAGNVTLSFNVNSDSGYSDEDGLSPTTCGHTAIDNVSLTGGVTALSDFENGADGWSLVLPPGVGDYSNIAHLLNDLDGPYGVACPCDLSDSVLVFADALGVHPTDQDNEVMSPWIDLKRGGDAGRPVKLVIYSLFSDLPAGNYVFVQFQARWYPAVCPETGTVYRTPFRGEGIVYFFGQLPTCNGPGTREIRDFSGVIDAGAEEVQLKFGVLNLCRTAPFGLPCSGTSNSTPWIDNVSLGVSGPGAAPVLVANPQNLLQDNFSSDGILNVASTARLDTDLLKGATTPGPGTILADTMVVGGDGGNTEVRVVFHVTRGPRLNDGALNAWAAARWTGEPALGADWYSARMDTAEQGGITAAGRWMSTLSEEDPKFVPLVGSRNDRAVDPQAPTQLKADIFPDNILTPGSRIDYFFECRYRPPDPRNPGGTTWYLLPDTTGGHTFEAEILPSSMQPDTTWNCFLYVDGHHDRAADEQSRLEGALKVRLGPGNSPEGTLYDRWDVQAPATGQLVFGRPLGTQYGCSISQVFAYKAILWASSTLGTYQLRDEEAALLKPWLTLQDVGGNRFWISGDDVASAVASSGQSGTVDFMQNVCGVIRICNTVRDADCPTGTAMDSTYCLPMAAVAGADFTSSPAAAAGNGCPDRRSFDLLGRSGATARGQLTYGKAGLGPQDFASVSNYVTIEETGFDFKTVWDGVAIGAVRSPAADPHNPSQCGNVTALEDRVAAILDWLTVPVSYEFCRPLPASDLGPIPDPGIPARPTLGPAFPNPLRRATRSRLTIPEGGSRVRLDIVDVTGRLVRTLIDGPLPAGPDDVAWDGRSADGRRVSSGLYFYRLTAPGVAEARKLVVVR